jgi:ribosome-associated protein
VVEIASDKQGSDILMLDLQGVSLLADYFVIVSAGSDRQINALRDEVVRGVRQSDPQRRVRSEGDPASGWVLLDLGDVVVHIFSEDEREYYGLERFWADARPVVQIQ